MRDIVEADSLKHLSIRSLSILAQRLRRVFASHEAGAERSNDTNGIGLVAASIPPNPRSASEPKAPGQLLHVDVTVIRLLDGTRAFLHAVQDNLSRRVMAWALRPQLTAETTRELVDRALQAIKTAQPTTRVMTDAGCENFCLTEISRVVHVIAQVDIAQSNSSIESLWSQIRSRWLYIHTLDSFQVLERLIGRYFNDHNELIPRAELSGRTPNEAFFEQEDDLATRLRMEHTQARIRRVAENQARRCPACSHQSTEPVM